MPKGFDTREFKRRPAKVPASIRREVNAALKQNAEEFVKMAQHLAPVDPVDGAHLRPSIRNHETDNGGQIVRAGGAETTKDGYDYAIGQEFGTQNMPASPFFWPTWRLLRKKFQSRRRRALNKAVKEFSK